MSLLSCKWITFFSKKEKYLFVFRKKKGYCLSQRSELGDCSIHYPSQPLVGTKIVSLIATNLPKRSGLCTNVWMKIQVVSIFFPCLSNVDSEGSKDDQCVRHIICKIENNILYFKNKRHSS